eukprot:2730501-Rhodomonas_salina.1
MQRQGKKRQDWGWGRRSCDGRLGAVLLIILVACLVLVTSMCQKLGLPSTGPTPLCLFPLPSNSSLQLPSAVLTHASRGKLCSAVRCEQRS